MKRYSPHLLQAEFLRNFEESPLLPGRSKEKDSARGILLKRLASPWGRAYLERKAKRRAQKQARRITRLNRK